MAERDRQHTCCAEGSSTSPPSKSWVLHITPQVPMVVLCRQHCRPPQREENTINFVFFSEFPIFSSFQPSLRNKRFILKSKKYPGPDRSCLISSNLFPEYGCPSKGLYIHFVAVRVCAGRPGRAQHQERGSSRGISLRACGRFLRFFYFFPWVSSSSFSQML